MTPTKRTLDLFAGVPEEEVDRILSLGSMRFISTGDTLFRLGDPAEHLYVMTQGRLKLTLPMQIRGRQEDVFVEERMPGQTVGWSALIPPYRFTLTAMALVDSEAVALPQEAVLQRLAACPDAGYRITLNLAAVIGQRLQMFQAMWIREMQHLVELRCA